MNGDGYRAPVNELQEEGENEEKDKNVVGKLNQDAIVNMDNVKENANIGAINSAGGVQENMDAYIGKCQLFCHYKPGTLKKHQAALIMMPFSMYSVFDMQMLNVAIYPIALYYGISTTLAQWFVLIRSISNSVFSIFTPNVMGRLGFRKHMIIFCIPIVISQCIVPLGSFPMAMVFRVIISICLAMQLPLMGPLLRTLVGAENLRGTMALNSIFQAIATGLSPFLGGVFCDTSYGWRIIPFVCAGTMLISFFNFLFCLPKIPKMPRRRIENAKMTKNPNFDVLGSLTIVIAVLSLSLVFSVFSIVSWYVSVILVSVCIVSFTIFVIIEKKLECNHILDPRVYKNKQIMSGFVVMGTGVMAIRLPTILGPLVFQQIYGLTTSMTGILSAIIGPVATVLSGLLVPKLCKIMKPYLVLIISMYVTGIFGLLMCVSFIQDSWVLVFIFEIFQMISVSFAVMANSASILLAAPPEIAPMIGSVQTLIAAFSGCLGTSIAVTVRDVLVPVFTDPTNPTSKTGIIMGSFISGMIISILTLSFGTFAMCTKPAGKKDYQKVENIIQNGELKMNGEQMLDESDKSVTNILGDDNVVELGVAGNAVDGEVDSSSSTTFSN